MRWAGMQRVGDHVELSAQEARQSRVTPESQLKEAIFLGGMIGCALLLMIAIALGTAHQL